MSQPPAPSWASTEPKARASSSAPPCTAHSRIPFLTNFSLDQLQRTRDVLSQFHPNNPLSSSAVIIIMRLQDRLAHYLLERAYYKEESEWAKGRGYTFAAPVQIKTQSMIEPRSIGDCTSHSILWRFPSHISLGLGDLGIHAASERIRAIEKLTHNWTKPTTEADQHRLVFTDPIVDRWLNDFAQGITMNRYEQQQQQQQHDFTQISHTSNSNNSSCSSNNLMLSLPSEMISHDSRIGLLAMVEYITSEILELAGNVAKDLHAYNLTPFHMLRSLRRDRELMQLFQFLSVNWNVGVRPQRDMVRFLDDPMALLPHSHRGLDTADAIPSIITLLNTEFANELESYRESHKVRDQTSWSSHPDRVKEVAQKLVHHGRIDYSPIALSLHKYHTRPYCYWGAQSEESLFGDITSNLTDDFEFPECWRYTSFVLTDAAGYDWHLMIELQGYKSEYTIIGCVYLLSHDQEFAYIGRFHPNPSLRIQMHKADQNLIQSINKSHLSATQENPNGESAKSTTGDVMINHSTMCTSASAPLTLTTSAFKLTPIEPRATPAAGDAVTVTSNVHTDKRVKVVYAPHGFDISLASDCKQTGFSPLDAIGTREILSINFKMVTEDKPSERSKVAPLSTTQKEIEFIIPHVLHIAMNHSQYSSSLYTASQSLIARRRFTTSLIDESFIHAKTKGELTSLMPSVLIDLITDYHSFYLPHLAEEMKSNQSSVP